MDFILLDTGAGLGRRVTDTVDRSPAGHLDYYPEPHAVTDAYALIKVLRGLGGETELFLLINMAESGREAELIASKMRFAAKEFLDYELKYLGYVPMDLVPGRSAAKLMSSAVMAGPGRRGDKAVGR